MTPQSNLNAIAQPAIDPKDLEKLINLSGRSLWATAVLGLIFPIVAYIYTKRQPTFYILFLLSCLTGLLTLIIVFYRQITNGSMLPADTVSSTIYWLFPLGMTIDNCAAILRARKKVELLTGKTPWKTANNQQVKNGKWPAWFPYPSSWLRAVALTLWIAVVVRIVTFWIAVIGITLSALEEDMGSFWRGLGLIIPLSVVILSYIHHILFFDEAKTPYRWFPSPRSLWEGVYAPIVALLSLIMVVVLLLPFFPIVPSCNYGAEFELASCLNSHEADVSNYLSTITEVSGIIWIVTSAYLYQIDYLIRNNFSLKTLAELIILGFIAFLAVSASSLLSKNSEVRQAINFPEQTKVPIAVNSEPTPSLPTAPTAKPLPPNPETVKSDSFGDAVNKATNAANLAQNAQTQTQWQAVVAEWQKAIALMKSVPQSSENYDVAQNRVVQYQDNVVAIKRRISRPFQQGIDAAQNAAFFATTAKSKAEWEFVATHWEEALASMKSVPPSNSNYAVAKNRVVQYQQNLNAARLAVSRAK